MTTTDPAVTSPAVQHVAILLAFTRDYVWPCEHAIELREERSSDLRCARCDRTVVRRTPKPPERTATR